MAFLLTNYGLDFLMEKEEMFKDFFSYIVQNGKELQSYYGVPYFFIPQGEAEFWARSRKNENGDTVVYGFDSHSCGSCIWEVEPVFPITPQENDDPMARTMFFRNYKDGKGLVPIDVINPEVLPGPMEGDNVKIQVVALPIDIKYYANEEEFENKNHKDINGKKLILADGILYPLNFLSNHSSDNNTLDEITKEDSVVVFRGTVKRLKWGTFEFQGRKENTFIRCVIGTCFGEMEIAHAVDQVNEEYLKNITPGAVVFGTCILSGDVAIYEYNKGIVKDHEHDLRVIRYTIENGRAERLRCILSENASFIDSAGKVYSGPDAIIERFQYVNNCNKGKYFAQMGTILDIDEGPELKYPIGTRCVMLSYGEKSKCDSLAFADCDSEGMIERIEITREKRYVFGKDEVPVREQEPTYRDVLIQKENNK